MAGIDDELAFEASLGAAPAVPAPTVPAVAAPAPAAPPAFDEEAFEASLAAAATVAPAPPAGGAGAAALAQLDAAEEAEAARREALQAEYGGVVGGLAALGQGTGRGLTFGATDVASEALTGALTPDAAQLTPEYRAKIEAYNRDHPDAPIALPGKAKSGYEVGSELARQAIEGAKAASPVLAATGEVGGAIAPAFVSGGLAYTPAALAEGLGARTAAKVAGTGAGIGREALAGLAGGAVEGGLGALALGTSEHLPEIIKDPGKGAEQVLQETAGGLVLGGLFSGALRGTGRALRGGAETLDEFGTTLEPKPAAVLDELNPQTADEFVVNFKVDAPSLEDVAANDNRNPLRKLVEQQDAVDTFQPYIAKTARDVSEDLDQFHRNQTVLRDNVMIKAKKASNDLLAEGLESELSNEVENLGQGEARNIVRARKPAVGAFDAIEGTDPLERAVAARNAADLAGQGTKRAHAPLERRLTTREVNVRNLYDDQIQRLQGFADNSSDGSARGLAPLIKETEQNKALTMKALREGRLGDAYHTMDQGMKAGLGYVGEHGSPQLKAAARDLYKGWQLGLEDANPRSGWGKIGENQAKVNPFLSEEITAKQASALQGLFERGRVKGLNEWDPEMITDPGRLESTLARLGDNATKNEIEALKAYLQTSTRSAIVRAQTWATPLGDLAAERYALENAKIMRRVIGALDDTLKKRADAVAGAAADRVSSTQEALQGALGMVSPRAAFAAQVTGSMKRKVIRAVAEAGNETGSRVVKSAAKLVRNAGKAADVAAEVAPRAAAIGTVALLSDRKREAAIEDAQALLDPRSQRARSLLREAAAIEDHEPEFAQAYVQAELARAQYIASKLPQQTSPAVFGTKPRLDPQKKRKLDRYIAAAYYPKQALERLGDGTASLEDVETAKTLYPSTYSDFVGEVAARLAQMKVPPSRKEQQKIHMLTGLAVRPSMEPQNLAKTQAVAQASSAGEDLGQTDGQGQGAQASPQMQGLSTNPDQYATRSDRIMSGGV